MHWVCARVRGGEGMAVSAELLGDAISAQSLCILRPALEEFVRDRRARPHLRERRERRRREPADGAGGTGGAVASDRSAGFQPAVSPISKSAGRGNGQCPETTRARVFADAPRVRKPATQSRRVGTLRRRTRDSQSSLRLEHSGRRLNVFAGDAARISLAVGRTGKKFPPMALRFRQWGKGL